MLVVKLYNFGRCCKRWGRESVVDINVFLKVHWCMQWGTELDQMEFFVLFFVSYIYSG